MSKKSKAKRQEEENSILADVLCKSCGNPVVNMRDTYVRLQQKYIDDEEHEDEVRDLVFRSMRDRVGKDIEPDRIYEDIRYDQYLKKYSKKYDEKEKGKKKEEGEKKAEEKAYEQTMYDTVWEDLQGDYKYERAVRALLKARASTLALNEMRVTRECCRTRLMRPTKAPIGMPRHKVVELVKKAGTDAKSFKMVEETTTNQEEAVEETEDRPPKIKNREKKNRDIVVYDVNQEELDEENVDYARLLEKAQKIEIEDILEPEAKYKTIYVGEGLFVEVLPSGQYDI